MIVKRTVRILVDGLVLNEFEYKAPMTRDEKDSMAFFLSCIMVVYPNAVIECDNEKDGVGEDIVLDGCWNDDDLFA